MIRGPYKPKTKPKTIFGQRLSIILEERGLTQAQMAKDINVYANAVHRWITHYEYPNATNIIAICKTYNVSADWLLGLSDERDLRGGQHGFDD